MERFSSASDVDAAPPGFHMERQCLLTPSVPARSSLGVSSLTLTNSEQESRFYLITMII